MVIFHGYYCNNHGRCGAAVVFPGSRGPWSIQQHGPGWAGWSLAEGHAPVKISEVETMGYCGDVSCIYIWVMETQIVSYYSDTNCVSHIMGYISTN